MAVEPIVRGLTLAGGVAELEFSECYLKESIIVQVFYSLNGVEFGIINCAQSRRARSSHLIRVLANVVDERIANFCGKRKKIELTKN